MTERPDAIAEQAIDWMVAARSGAMSERQRLAMQAWLAQDTRHRLAWERLHGMLDGTAHLRRQGLANDARDLLLQPHRRAVLRSLLALAVAGGALALADRGTPLRTLTADLRTGTGQRRDFDLPDGSRVTLNARSAVDVAFDGSRRLLRLRMGELLVRVAADAARPFVVETAQGAARALGTRFCVRQEDETTLAAVLEHRVEVATRGGARQELAQGQMARFGSAAIETLAGDAAQLAEWAEGRLSVLDVPLAEVVERLRPYRRGLLRVAPEAAHLRVQGVFPLDDSDRALRALAETLPIRLRHYGPLVVIEAAA